MQDAEIRSKAELIGTLPFRSDVREEFSDDFDVSVWKSDHNICGYKGDDLCDELAGIYYGSTEAKIGMYCPRHFYRMHEACGGIYRLRDRRPAHTPGPWSHRRSENKGVGLLIEGRNHRRPLPVRPGEQPAYEGIIVAELDEVPEAEANARLIAAAPDLLRAARLALDELQQRDEFSNGPTHRRTNEAVDALNEALLTAEE